MPWTATNMPNSQSHSFKKPVLLPPSLGFTSIIAFLGQIADSPKVCLYFWRSRVFAFPHAMTKKTHSTVTGMELCTQDSILSNDLKLGSLRKDLAKSSLHWGQRWEYLRVKIACFFEEDQPKNQSILGSQLFFSAEEAVEGKAQLSSRCISLIASCRERMLMSVFPESTFLVLSSAQ